MQYQKHPRYRATEPKLPVADDDFDYEADTPMCAVPMPARLYNALKRATQQSGDITLREFADTYSGYFLRMSNQGLGQSTLNMFNEILDRVDLKLTTKRTTVIPSAHTPDPRLLNEQIAKPPISGSNHDLMLIQINYWMQRSIDQFQRGLALLNTLATQDSRPSTLSKATKVGLPVNLVSADVLEIVRDQADMTEFVEKAILFYNQYRNGLFKR